MRIKVEYQDPIDTCRFDTLQIGECFISGSIPYLKISLSTASSNVFHLQEHRKETFVASQIVLSVKGTLMIEKRSQ